jgi:hypothetical protein
VTTDRFRDYPAARTEYPLGFVQCGETVGAVDQVVERPQQEHGIDTCVVCGQFAGDRRMLLLTPTAEGTHHAHRLARDGPAGQAMPREH